MLKHCGRANGIMETAMFSQTNGLDEESHVEFSVRALDDGIELWISDTTTGGFGRKKAHTRQIYHSYTPEAYKRLLALLNSIEIPE